MPKKLLLILGSFCLSVVAGIAVGRPTPRPLRGAGRASPSWTSTTLPCIPTRSAIFGTNVDIGKGIADLLVTDLVKDGTYSIIERKALDKIMTEQNFSNSNRADPTSAAKTGQAAGRRRDPRRQHHPVRQRNQEDQPGRHGRQLGRLRPGRHRPLQLQGQRRHQRPLGERRHRRDHGRGRGHGPVLPIQHFDAGRRRQLARIRRRQRRLRQQRLPKHHHRRGHQDSRRQAHRRSGVQRPAIVACARLPSRAWWLRSTAARSFSTSGARAGVKVGDQLEVVRVTKEIKDPATGAVIRRLTSSIGVVKATDVDDASAVCTPVSGSGFKVGDR